MSVKCVPAIRHRSQTRPVSVRVLPQLVPSTSTLMRLLMNVKTAPPTCNHEQVQRPGRTVMCVCLMTTLTPPVEFVQTVPAIWYHLETQPVSRAVVPQLVMPARTLMRLLIYVQTVSAIRHRHQVQRPRRPVQSLELVTPANTLICPRLYVKTVRGI